MIPGRVQHLVARSILVVLPATVGSMPARAQSGDQLAVLRAAISGLRSQGKYTDAAAVAEGYVALTRQKYGQDHSEYATAILWLAYAYEAQGRYPEAEPLLKRALAIREKALGPEHPRLVVAGELGSVHEPTPPSHAECLY